MQERNNPEEQAGRGEAAGRSSRRKLLKAGAFVVPAIVTLHARSAFAAGTGLNPNYADKKYKYGDFSGLTTFERIDAEHGGGGTWDPDPLANPNASSYTYTDHLGNQTVYTFP